MGKKLYVGNLTYGVNDGDLQQLFAAHGYVVLMTNYHGSTGYGQKFVEEISGDWGGDRRGNSR